MSIILDKDVYNWLLAMEAVKVSIKGYPVQDDKIELESAATMYFSSGLVLNRLLEKLLQQMPKNSVFSPEKVPTDALKHSQSPTSRASNWNSIFTQLKKLGLPVDPEIKNLVQNGDLEMISEVMTEIYKFYHPKGKIELGSPTSGKTTKHDLASLGSRGSFVTMSKSLSLKTGNNSPPPKKYKLPETVDINNVNINKELVATSNVLEFFVNSLCKHLSLQPKQVVSLLSNGFKYLAHLFAKGVKGVFEPIVYWYKDLYANTPFLITLIQKDPENNIALVQQACKSGLVSKNQEVVQWACKFYSKLALEFANSNLINSGWEWFISEHGGLYSCLLGLRRHPDIADDIISVFVQYARYNLIEMLTIHLKNVFSDPKEHLAVMKDLFKPLTESKLTKEEISISGVIDAWLETIMKYSEDGSLAKDVRLSALSLLCDFWFSFPSRIEEQDTVANGILNSLKKAVRDSSKSLSISAFALLFKLLDNFA